LLIQRILKRKNSSKDISMRKKTFRGVVLLLIVLALFYVTGQILPWGRGNFSPISTATPSIRPDPYHPLCIRFDPSFHYGAGQRPENLARSLAEQWHRSSVGIVFYRAYDPKHGSFYRTEYLYTSTDDYGKYDLLKHVIKECHDRNIQVFAWLPVLDNATAWEQNPRWRTLRPSGEPYRAQGLYFPLCARQKEVRSWWAGFLEDLITRYPELDGIDFGEPVVSWSEGDACDCHFCRLALKGAESPAERAEIRARALTTLLGDSIELVHRFKKTVSVTAVQSAERSGRLITADALKKITGFDRDAVLNARDARRPDIFCTELIWQEMKSRFPASDGDSVFSPDWTKGALEELMAGINSPVKIFAHVEMTDFPGIDVSVEMLRDSIRAAIDGGAAGIDIYSSNEIEKKSAWHAVGEAETFVKTKRCLVLHDGKEGENDAIQIQTLLHHFVVETTRLPVAEYLPSMMQRYDAVFYVGVVSGSPIPESFVSDVIAGLKPVCWLGFNFERVLNTETAPEKLGLEFIRHEKDLFGSVLYEGHALPKKDPWTSVVKVVDTRRCRVIAEASAADERVPYAIRSGRRLWYFADVPTSHAIEGGRFLVFADLLHDILNEPHRRAQTALVRIEDINPMTDPKALTRIADFLHQQNVPFFLSVVPFYLYPEKNLYVPLSEKPDLVDAIRYSIRKGGAVVMHGTTHQRFGETTSDYEFWDAVNNGAPQGETVETLVRRLERGLQEFWSVQIYPLLWETPHYAGSQQVYQAVGSIFSVAMERRQSIDQHGTDQYFPYVIMGDRHGQILVPENLGYVPLNDQRAEVVLAPARRMKSVRDGVASFFFHPFVDIEVLKTIVRTMKTEGFRFSGVADLPLRVETSFGAVTNRPGKLRLSPESVGGKALKLEYPGAIVEERSIQHVDAAPFTYETAPENDRLEAVYFLPSAVERERRRTGETDAAEATAGTFMTVSNLRGEQCGVPRPLVLDVGGQSLAPSKQAAAVVSLFDLVGIHAERVDAFSFSEIPAGSNLVFIPEPAAQQLSSQQITVLLSALKKGWIGLITEGSSALADELGIQNESAKTAVRNVKDNFFPDVAIRWDPSPSVIRFAAPAEASYVYEDRTTGWPLVVSCPYGKGTFLYLQTPSDTDTEIYARGAYPHLISHVFRIFQFFPILRRASYDIYFNPAERSEVSIESLVKDWRRTGVDAVYVAAWQVFPDWTYDYQRLIRLAHTNGMIVYAWFEFPHVNEKLWLDHPEWREKNAMGKDAVVDWRKPMALGDPACFSAVKAEVRRILNAYDFDGVVLNRVGWEIGAGYSDPKNFTPFHPTASGSFKNVHGFAPGKLFDPASRYFWEKNPKAVERFATFRSRLAVERLAEMLSHLEEINRTGRRGWEVIVTFDETRPHCGVSTEDLVSLHQRFDFRLQLATTEERQWRGFSAPYESVQLFIAPSRAGNAFYPRAPSSYPTGTALYERFYRFFSEGKAFSLNSENAFLEIDKGILPLISQSQARIRIHGESLQVETPGTAQVVFGRKKWQTINIDGKTAGSYFHNSLIIPAGVHRISPANDFGLMKSLLHSDSRLTDNSGKLVETRILPLGLEISYHSPRRAAFVVSDKPLTVTIDDKPLNTRIEKGLKGWSIIAPPGTHDVYVKTRNASKMVLSVFSLVLSRGILAISLTAILLLVAIALVTTRRRSKGAERGSPS
jgi:hypothetical protein